mmetsp:Transcript_33928/g.86003  ORF Transcript_33928/g.86003 Transcript_33928/m.86003 type:complete len:253 (+) Transcript_33928:727-1485(+)
MFAHLWNVVSRLHSALPYAHGRCQHQRAGWALGQELLFHHPQHGDVVVIVRDLILVLAIHLRIAVVARNDGVLPVQIEAVEAPLAAEGDHPLREEAAVCFRGRNGGEDLARRRALAVGVDGAIVEVPAAHADECLGTGVLRLHAHRQSLVPPHCPRRGAGPLTVPVGGEARIVAGRRAQLILRRVTTRMVSVRIIALDIKVCGHCGEAVHEVRAQAGRQAHLEDVLALVDEACPVARPIGEVAHVDALGSVG